MKEGTGRENGNREKWAAEIEKEDRIKEQKLSRKCLEAKLKRESNTNDKALAA